MPKRKILQTVFLHRNGERVKPAIGSIIDLTDEEYKWLTANAPESIGKPVAEVDMGTTDGLDGISDADRQKLKDQLRAEILAEGNGGEPEKTETAAQKKAREAKEAKDAAAANKDTDEI